MKRFGIIHACLTGLLFIAATLTAVTAAPAAETNWVYHNGKFLWRGDWSASATPNYKDQAGVPSAGRYDIAVTTQKWGLWQPYFDAACQSTSAQCFDTRPYTYLIFSAKPTVRNQVFQVGFMSSGDTKDGSVIVATPYCSGGADPAIGEWESCKMPLSVFKFIDTKVLKFWIQDQTGLDANLWYVEEVGFTDAGL